MTTQKKTVKQKLQGMFPKIPDVGQITSMLDERFQKLLDKLDEILVELKKQNGGSA